MPGVRSGHAHIKGGHGVESLAVYLQATAQDVGFPRSKPGYINAVTHEEILRGVVMINGQRNDN